MRFLQTNTTSVSSKALNLGLSIGEDDLIDSKTYINLEYICYIKEFPENKDKTIIGCTNGVELISTYSLQDITDILGLNFTKED